MFLECDDLAVSFIHLDDNALNLRVGLETVFAQLSADTRLFETTKWSLCFENVIAVHPKYDNASHKKK